MSETKQARTVETKADALEIQDAVNAALDAARAMHAYAKTGLGAVNWDEVSCTDVEERRSLLRDSRLVAVVIEEASPSAAGLQRHIGAVLDAHGWELVYVATEW